MTGTAAKPGSSSGQEDPSGGHYRNATAESLNSLISHPFFKGPVGAALITLALWASNQLGDIKHEQQRQSIGISALVSDVALLKADFTASKQATQTDLVAIRGRVEVLETRIASYERDAAERRQQWDELQRQHREAMREWRSEEPRRQRE